MLFPTTSLCIILQRKFWQKYFVAIYAPEAYIIILKLFGLLQHQFFKQFPKFLNNKNNDNTYKYIALSKKVIGYIMEALKNNIKRNIISAMSKYCLVNRIDKRDNID